ncbi:MAG TPA: hypothetical protein VKA69_10360 [Desulfobacteria bacterium]|nr:hypothetical protein [Desulfobacteria bacterium]
MTQNRIALKPYLEQIKEFCLPLSKEELTEVVAGLGKDVSTSERMGFLEKLESILPGHTPLKVPETVGIDDVLNDIQGLRESIEERVESIEDGSFWDDPDVYDEDGYDDEDPEYVSDEQIKDVMDAREGPMGGLDAFLPEWKMMLGPLEMSSRAGFLLLRL